jgi:hypothetical protein
MKLIVLSGLIAINLGALAVGAGGQKGLSKPVLPKGEFCVVRTPNSGDTVKSGLVTFAGLANPKSTVVVLGDGCELGRGDVAADGRFGVTVRIERPFPKEVLVQQVGDRNDMVVQAKPLELKFQDLSNQRSFTISRPIDGGVMRENRWSIAGTGTPGKLIRIQMDKWLMGYATVGEDGTWTYSRAIDSPGVKREFFAREIGGASDEILVRRVMILP